MMLYERRIENSLYRTMNQLKQLQRKRKVEDAAAEKEFEARRKRVRAAMGLPARECDAWSQKQNKVKKQTQFAPDREGVKSCGEGSYEENGRPEPAENKASQSQSKGPARPKRVPGVLCKSSANGRLTVV
jgi:hypothetical protein